MMKYKDWIKQLDNFDSVNGKAIRCPECGEIVGYEKDFMFMVIKHPIVCTECDEIVIYPTANFDYPEISNTTGLSNID